jgi:hypothetical protein
MGALLIAERTSAFSVCGIRRARNDVVVGATMRRPSTQAAIQLRVRPIIGPDFLVTHFVAGL